MNTKNSKFAIYKNGKWQRFIYRKVDGENKILMDRDFKFYKPLEEYALGILNQRFEVKK